MVWGPTRSQNFEFCNTYCRSQKVIDFLDSKNLGQLAPEKLLTDQSESELDDIVGV